MNSQALTRLIPCLIPLIHGVAHRYLLDQIEVEDITQDVLLKLVRATRKETLRPSSVHRWIFVTTKNTSIDALRQLRRRRDHEDDNATAALNSLTEQDRPPLETSAAQPQNADFELVEQLARILEVLPEFQRSALLMSAAGYSYSDIASLQRVSVGTVRSRIHYARSKAQPLLEAYR